MTVWLMRMDHYHCIRNTKYMCRKSIFMTMCLRRTSNFYCGMFQCQKIHAITIFLLKSLFSFFLIDRHAKCMLF